MTIGTKNQKELEKIKYDKNLNENTNHGDDSIQCKFERNNETNKKIKGDEQFNNYNFRNKNLPKPKLFLCILIRVGVGFFFLDFFRLDFFFLIEQKNPLSTKKKSTFFGFFKKKIRLGQNYF